jgi:hypothetical protein
VSIVSNTSSTNSTSSRAGLLDLQAAPIENYIGHFAGLGHGCWHQIERSRWGFVFAVRFLLACNSGADRLARRIFATSEKLHTTRTSSHGKIRWKNQWQRGECCRYEAQQLPAYIHAGKSVMQNFCEKILRDHVLLCLQLISTYKTLEAANILVGPLLDRGNSLEIDNLVVYL